MSLNRENSYKIQCGGTIYLSKFKLWYSHPIPLLITNLPSKIVYNEAFLSSLQIAFLFNTSYIISGLQGCSYAVHSFPYQQHLHCWNPFHFRFPSSTTNRLGFKPQGPCLSSTPELLDQHYHSRFQGCFQL